MLIQYMYDIGGSEKPRMAAAAAGRFGQIVVSSQVRNMIPKAEREVQIHKFIWSTKAQSHLEEVFNLSDILSEESLPATQGIWPIYR